MSVVSAARNVLAEFRVCAQSPDDFRAQAFTRYLQMQARVILGRRFPRAYPMPKSSRIFGRTWSCPNYEAALGIFKEVFVAGEYHFAASSPNPVVVDAGANIGLASLYFHLLYPECRVVAFEPDVAAFSALRQNVQANGLNVQCVNAGLWALEGTHTIYTDPSNEAGVSASMFQCSNLTTAVDIQVVQLTEIRQAIVEFHPHKGQPENKLDECIGLLQERFSVEVSDVHGATMVWALAKQR